MNKTLLLLLAVMFISCNSTDEEKNITKPQAEPALRADTIEVPFRIEGMVAKKRMYLLESPKGFPLKFSTYIPVEMVTETVNRENGKAINIIANFGGILNRDARLTIFAFPSGSAAKEIHARVTEIAGHYSAVPADSTLYPWAEKVYDLRDNTFGFLAVGRKNGGWFYILAAYPPRYGDGMAPRINLILEKWRWTDGESLSSVSAD